MSLGGRGSILSGKSGVGFIIGAIVVMLLAAFILPTAIGSFENPESRTVTQEEGEVIKLAPTLNATLNDVDDGDSSINVTLGDTETNETVSATSIALEANETVTINTREVTINNTANVNTSTATIRYEYPADYSWDGGASSMFGLLGLLFALVAFMLIIGWVMDVI